MKHSYQFGKKQVLANLTPYKQWQTSYVISLPDDKWDPLVSIHGKQYIMTQPTTAYKYLPFEW